MPKPSNLRLPIKKPCVSMLFKVPYDFEYIFGACSQQVLAEDEHGWLAKYVKCKTEGSFVKAIYIRFPYFLVNGVYKLGYVQKALESLFDEVLVHRKIKDKNYVFCILWSDSLTHLQPFYSHAVSDIKIHDRILAMTAEINRVIKVVRWVKEQKKCHQKSAKMEKVENIFSEYVRGVGVPLSTLQSSFLSHARNYRRDLQRVVRGGLKRPQVSKSNMPTST